MRTQLPFARLLLFALLFFAIPRAHAETFFVFTPAGNIFSPAQLTINQGDTVIWTNRTGTLHDSVSFQNVWRSPLFGFRQSFSFTFNVAPGNYDYYCTPHLSVGMVGTITVRAPVNDPPIVSIASPANNATFGPNDSITVVVSASDPGGSVASVQLLVNGAATQTDTTAPYEFPAALGAGTYTIAARATDNLGAQTTSLPITITVNGPNQPPTVALTSPAGGTFTAPAELTLAANAQDDRAVARVEFIINDAVFGEDTSEPYSLPRTFNAGTYRLLARAFDAEGLFALSAVTTITVEDPLPEFPTVMIHSPAPGEYVYLADRIALSALANDANGSIARVVFNEGEVALGEAIREGATSMYSLAIPLTEGAHTITATATDNLGNATTSNPVTFIVVLSPEFAPPLILESGAARVGVFGTSGVPFVFQRSIDGGQTWTSFLTNSLVRRIRFFDDEMGGANVLYRAVSPDPAIPEDPMDGGGGSGVFLPPDSLHAD